MTKKKETEKQTTTASNMSGEEFKKKLEKIGFTQVGFGRTISVNGATVRKWIYGTFPVPMTVAMLVNLMIKTKSTPEDLKG